MGNSMLPQYQTAITLAALIGFGALVVLAMFAIERLASPLFRWIHRRWGQANG